MARRLRYLAYREMSRWVEVLLELMHVSNWGGFCSAGVSPACQRWQARRLRYAARRLRYVACREMSCWAEVSYGCLLTTQCTRLRSGYGLERPAAVRAGILIRLMARFSSAFAALLIGEKLFFYHAAGFAMAAGGAILGCLRSEPVLSSQA